MMKKKSPHKRQSLKVSSLNLAGLRLSKLAILLGDLLALSLSFLLAIHFTAWIETDSITGFSEWLATQDAPRFVSWAMIAIFGVVLLLMRYQHYSDRRPFWDELSDLTGLVILLSLLDMAIVALAQWQNARLWWLVSWAVVFVMLLTCRFFTRYLLKKIHLWIRPTIIIGIGPNAAEATLALKSQPEMGLDVRYFVDPGGCQHEEVAITQPRLSVSQVPEIVTQPGIQWVIALEHSQSEQRENWLRQLAQWGVSDVSVIPAMRGVPLHGTDMSHFFSHEVALLRMRNNLRRWPARLTKRIFDTLAAILILILLSPVMLAIGYLVRRDGGAALFAHPRIGKKGRVFKCYKFRTMVVDAEKRLEELLQKSPELMHQWQQERKLRQDPRVNRIGRILRMTSLDELPQLINVIRGEMSLVGPRPVVRAELTRYADQVGYYLMVRPGMTGLWQVSGRNDVDYETRVYLDSWYVKNWSLWYDLLIILKTVKVVFVRSGAY